MAGEQMWPHPPIAQTEADVEASRCKIQISKSRIFGIAAFSRFDNLLLTFLLITEKQSSTKLVYRIWALDDD